MTITEPAKRLFKGLLSIWILYHVFVIVLAPNSGSFPGRRLSDFYVPYANALNLNSSWNFFSPDPAHIMYFRYTVYFRNDMMEDLQEPVEGYFPPSKEIGPYEISLRRESYAMRFMILDPRRVEQLLGPWLCRQFPEASNIKLEHIIDAIPPMDQVYFNSKRRYQDLAEKVESINRDFDCRSLAEEYAPTRN